MSEDHFYIGRKKCGCLVAFIIDEPQYTERVVEFVRSGYTIERVSAAQVRRDNLHLTICTHGPVAAAEAVG